MSRPLPQPSSERWQPLRTGLVDVFYYDHEEFWFRDGRLLLRGNNGTGKSKVLALTLPFLLDGELSPHRVEPDADPKKRMEWNLLLGGEHPHAERLGYTWLELGRRDDDGTVAFCTLGCGLKAVAGRGIAAHWFFLTRQRVGEQLALVDGAGIALTRERLEEALGAHGAVHRTARAYRRAVDETLFGLGELRYGALVDLLIKIRAPQLSKRPNERALSDALTEALAPLDQALVADVAEAFRSLEEDREALAAMIEARDAAGAYLATYRHYAQVACRRRAAPPRRAQTTFDRVSRELAEADAAHARAEQELATAAARFGALRTAEATLRARDRALRDGPEARSARELAHAAEEARASAERAAEAAADRARAGQRRARGVERVEHAEQRRGAAVETLTAARAIGTAAAAAALVSDAYCDEVDTALDEAPAGTAGTDPTSGAVTRLRDPAERLEQRQARAVAHAQQLLDEAADRERALAQERRRRDELAGEGDMLAGTRELATAQLDDAARELHARAHAQLDRARAVTLSDPAGVLAALELWAETLDGPNPHREAVQAAGREAAGALARSAAELAARGRDAERRARELAEAIERLESGEHDAPPVPHTRDPAPRVERSGAPLWQLVDFRDDVPHARRGPLEAALEAAGVLDAWVDPDGTLVAPASGDLLLAPRSDAVAERPRLDDVLVPAIDAADPRAAQVSEAVLARLLAAIALGEQDATVWIGDDGGFRNGILRGAWRKPTATFIGRGAREAARRARLVELRAQAADVARELAAVAGEHGELAAARERLEAELADVPTDDELRAAHAALAALDAERRRLDERIEAADRQLGAVTAASAAAQGALEEAAAELGLPAVSEELAAVRNGLAELRTALAGLWPAVTELERARAGAVQAAAELAEAERDLAGHGERVARTAREAVQSAERHRTLAATVGTAVAELQAQLAEASVALHANEQQRERADAQRLEATGRVGREAARREDLGDELERAAEERLAQVDALRRFAGTGLVAVALPALEPPTGDDQWGVTAALRLARQIEQELADVVDDDRAWERAQRRANDELGALADALRRHGNNASTQLEEGGIRVEVVFRGHATTVPALTAALVEEVEDRRRLLDEREREILENHLVNEVASTLQELISAAEGEVLRMNAELADRPTSTGMRLRLLWRPAEDGPQGLAVARERLLRQTADAWSEEDRSAVGAFLQAQIQQVRARDAAGTWVEHLTEALDYRAWHRFVIQRHQGGRWQSATGPASGGERVLAASVPLFAAASAHYASAANPHAPRLVTLDEAFAGVDDDARAKCLGLLTAFDLDVVMTSEREWGCYPEVPGLAIAQLTRVDGVAAVLVTHWEWDGATRVRVDRPEVPLPEPAAAVADPAAQEGLWAPRTTDG